MIFVDGGVGAVAVQMAVARGARVIASASEANQDYLREIRAIPVLYGEGVAARVRAAGEPVDAVFDVAGKTPAGELISLVSRSGRGPGTLVRCRMTRPSTSALPPTIATAAPRTHRSSRPS